MGAPGLDARPLRGQRRSPARSSWRKSRPRRARDEVQLRDAPRLPARGLRCETIKTGRRARLLRGATRPTRPGTRTCGCSSPPPRTRRRTSASGPACPPIVLREPTLDRAGARHARRAHRRAHRVRLLDRELRPARPVPHRLVEDEAALPGQGGAPRHPHASSTTARSRSTATSSSTRASSRSPGRCRSACRSYFGAMRGPKSFQAAGELSDGCHHALSYSQEAYEYLVENLQDRRGARPARTGRTLDIGAWCVIACAPDSARPRRPRGRMVALLHLRRCRTSSSSAHGIDPADIAPIVEALGKGELDKALELTSPEIAERLSIAGTPEECVAKIKEIESAGVNHMILCITDPPIVKAVHTGEDVDVPDVNGQLRADRTTRSCRRSISRCRQTAAHRGAARDVLGARRRPHPGDGRDAGRKRGRLGGQVARPGARRPARTSCRLAAACSTRRAGSDPEAEARRLHADDPDGFSALAQIASGGYYMNLKIRKRIGYPGQGKRPPFADEAEYDLRDGLLDPVFARGPINTTRAPGARPARAGGAALVLDLGERRPRPTSLVIGAGAGGSVAARHLAEAGFKVVCLEQGGWENAVRLPGRQARVGARRRRAVEPEPEHAAAPVRLPARGLALADHAGHVQRGRRQHGPLLRTVGAPAARRTTSSARCTGSPTTGPSPTRR